MAAIRKFEEIKAWQKARELAMRFTRLAGAAQSARIMA